MLWKTILRRVYKFTLENPDHVSTRMIRTLARGMNEPVNTYLDMIDVRKVGELRKIIPEAFPKKLQRLPLKVSQNIHGAWCVDATNKEPT